MLFYLLILNAFIEILFQRVNSAQSTEVLFGNLCEDVNFWSVYLFRVYNVYGAFWWGGDGSEW